jgi:hypothetical protein
LIRARCIHMFNDLNRPLPPARLIWTALGFSPHVRPEGLTHMFSR